MMMTQSVNEFIIPYITDGLVFYLDGIKKGNNNNGWQDLISGNVFPWVSRTTRTNNGVSFSNANNQSLTNNNIGDFPPDSSTIEVCCSNCSDQQYRVIVYIRKGLIFTRDNATQICWRTSANNNRININIPLTFTASANSDRGMVNSVVSYSYASTSWATASGVTIGNRGSSNYNFVGTLHSVRIYNRKISEEEMLYNQRIDNERFNLGLNI